MRATWIRWLRGLNCVIRTREVRVNRNRVHGNQLENSQRGPYDASVTNSLPWKKYRRANNIHGPCAFIVKIFVLTAFRVDSATVGRTVTLLALATGYRLEPLVQGHRVVGRSVSEYYGPGARFVKGPEKIT